MNRKRAVIKELSITNSRPNRLFRYDNRIVINATRATFSRWHDQLVAATMLLFGLAVVRSWFQDRSWPMGAWAIVIAGILIGLTAGRMIAARLAFHSADGPLAADALCPKTRWRYLIALHAIGLTLLIAVTLVARPSLLIASLPGYLIGALVGHGTEQVAMRGFAGEMTGLVRAARARIQRPSAGIIAAAILLISVHLFSRSVGGIALMTVAGIATAMLALAVTIVDAATIRFMTVAGYGPWRIVAWHAHGAVLFSALVAPVSALVFGVEMAGTVVAASIAALMLMTIRIFAYSVHDKRIADMIVFIVSALLILVAVYAAPVLPVIAVAILWQMQRRASAMAWMLA